MTGKDASGKITSLSSCGDDTVMTPVSPCKENPGGSGGFCDTMRYFNVVCRVSGSSLSSAVSFPTTTPVSTTQQFLVPEKSVNKLFEQVFLL